MLDFEVLKDMAEGSADCAGFLGAAAGNDGSGELGGVGGGDGLADVDQGSDEAEVARCGVGNGWKGGHAPGVHGVAEERFAEIVHRVAEGDDIDPHALSDFVHGAATEATAHIAAMVGLFFEEAKAGAILKILPFDAASAKVLAKRLDGGEKFALFDGEGGDGKLDRGALLQQDERFEQGHGVLTAG